MKLGDVPGRFKELINRAGEKVSRLPVLVNGRVVWENTMARNGVFFTGRLFSGGCNKFFGGEENVVVLLQGSHEIPKPSNMESWLIIAGVSTSNH